MICGGACCKTGLTLIPTNKPRFRRTTTFQDGPGEIMKTLFTWSLLLSTVVVVQAAELPVRQVILYKHGVGYFERAGQLGPGESARLDFKASEMNDVLKSLTVEEKGGGKISGLRYDSSVPLNQKLAEFPFQLPPGAPLSAVLDQLKGARVELTFGNEIVKRSEE